MRHAQDHQAMLATWQRHTHAEFVLKDADAALVTMTDNPYVICVPSGTSGVGRAGVHAYYAEQFLPCIPPDFELESVSQIFGGNHIVEEFVVRFTHTLAMDWMLPGVPATGRKTEFAFVGVIRFEAGKIASEHLHWDQAAVLAQLGALHRVTAIGVRSAARLLRLAAPQPANDSLPQEMKRAI